MKKQRSHIEPPKSGQSGAFDCSLLIAASVLDHALPPAKSGDCGQSKQETFKYTLQVPLDGLDGIELASVQTLLTRRTPATGRKIVGISRAVGAVTLINQSQSEAAVAKGTILETGSGILFRTTKDVVVPAVTTQYFMDIPTGLTAGKAEVEIEAVEAGSQECCRRADCSYSWL